jgi:hydroxymethylpyrimidine kinase/phosphomethylpyrimidine kinase
MSVVCSIGTTEPHHAVGLLLDIHVFSELGVRPVSVIAAVSAQDARGVHAFDAVRPEIIEAQLAVLHDAGIAAYRIGALAEEKAAESIASCIARYGRPVVYDPVAAASTGGTFVHAAILQGITEKLSSVTTIITPNLLEAGLLIGSVIRSVEDMTFAARAIAARGELAVFIKGGHLAGKPQDVLFCEEEVHVFTSERIPGEMRGTGCILAASLAAALAQGVSVFEAVRRSRVFVQQKIASADTFASMRLAY